MKLEKAKLEQKRKYEKKIYGEKRSKHQRQAVKIGYYKVQRHPHRLSVPHGKFSPAHRDNKGEPWCAANPNQSLVQRHLDEVRPPERSGNRWLWFEERGTRLLNPRNKRMRKNQDGNRHGETWRTDSWTYALWMDHYVSWERTTPNQDVSDPDNQSWLWRAVLARFMCLD